MAKLDVQKARDLLQAFDFGKLFVEELGWSQPTSRQRTYFGYKDDEFQRKQIAQLSGVAVLEVTSTDGKIPDRKTLAAIHKEISKIHHENLLIFVDAQRTQSLWYWVKREDGKLRPREPLYVKGQPGDLFLSKFSSMFFDISEFDEAGNVSVVNVAKRLRDAFDVQPVTKKFFRDYDTERLAFLDLIKGIADERQRRWYASVLLNRLMFIYFLQRKGFIDDENQGYLNAKLEQCKKLFGKDQYYEKFLKPLFFEGFAKPEEDRSTDARKLLGKIKYLNGGLFLPHRVELDNPDIRIPDKAFENLLALFQAYSWNLNDTPGGEDNEINPDVLGYIFEKYINQKAFGAYYTRPEITEYLCEQTIYKLILEKISSPGIEGLMQPRSFDSMSELLLNLDAPLCRELLDDVLPTLTLLDPACGSGAFLVAAMKTLVNIYAAVIGKIQFLNDRQLSEWLRRARKEHPSVAYYIKKRIITDNLYGVDIMDEATEIARLRLFLALVASAETVDQLEPLPNIDFNILKGNSLIGLMHINDEDFDARQAQGNLFRKSYRELLAEKNRLIDIYRHTGEYTDDLRSLRDDIDQKKREAIETLDDILLSKFQSLGIKFEQATWDDKKNKEGKSTRRALTIKDIEALEPFHWGYEFDEVLNHRGGFDVIIANPPWEVLKPNGKEFFLEHSELVRKKKMDIKAFDKEQGKLMRDAEVARAWIEYQSSFPHVSAYFRSTKQYENQISVVNGKRVGTDINFYKLFFEQAFNLLKPSGRCGIILQSGIYSDLGAKQLRQILFSRCQLDSVYGLANERFIFENVDHRQKFCILVFERGGQTESFEAAFRVNPREAVAPDELDYFLNSSDVHVDVPVALVRHLSPDSLSIMEFRKAIDVSIAEKMSQFPLLGERGNNMWDFALSREFDMTNDSDLFDGKSTPGALPLYEGKMIHQFTHQWSDSPRYWVKEMEGRKRVIGRGVPDVGQQLDYQKVRLGLRSIGRTSDTRTLIAGPVPPDVFCGNSILVIQRSATVGTPISDQEIVFAVAVLNSFVVDYYIRQMVSANLNMFYVYQLPLPRLTVKDPAFAPLVQRAGKLICTTADFDDLAREIGLSDTGRETNPTNRAQLRAELDGMVAQLYGLTEEEFTHILSTFPLVEQSVKDAALDAYREFAPKPGDQEVAALIAKGESATLEFKPSARWDLKLNIANKDMEHVIVKTVAALLNTEGGDLLIGVADDGSILGLDKDYKMFGKKNSRDAFENFLTTLLLNNLGKDSSALFSITFHVLEGKDVVKVAVKPSPKPVYDKDGHLYIRAGNSTRQLNARETVDYCKLRWP